MPILRIALLTLSLATAACSQSNTPQTAEDPSAHLTMEDISPTIKFVAPSTWANGKTWRFTERDKQGNVVRTSVLRITDKRATSCMAGEWRRLEVIEGDAKFPAPAWGELGGKPTVMLSPEACDNYYVYVGAFIGDAFEGHAEWLGLGRADDFGAVRGEPVSSATK
ncbi:hypothetical protein [Noviluteimonas gilva]|uniref:Uncharacterized protein n=1 Tax=Noviluteimonas gilva TaxID=2682097 RepID=A0A7C9LGX2_9GAMM|nr:hypothetical protein [Lysobacter gilvus]MUV14361.1 hypothetical protein [Lysobacter gilvus]